MTTEEFINMKVDSDIDAVIIAYKKTLSYADICYTHKVLQLNPQALVIAGNIDNYWKVGQGILPDTGSFVQSFEKVITFGKPEKSAFDMINQIHFKNGIDKSKTIMIGDTIE